jgi:hypothetical protein
LGTDAALAVRKRDHRELSARAEAMEVLREGGVPFLVGGAYAYAQYTGIYRDTKDLDLFLRRMDAPRALDLLAKDGWRTERTDAVWLYKAFRGEWYVDFIFSSGNGIAEVDDLWFLHSLPAVVFGQQTRIIPAEEMIWSKGFVLERERYDGSDVLHVLRASGSRLDWERLLWRFQRYWEVLMSHLLLFRFAYPTERDQVPEWVMRHLSNRLRDSQDESWRERVCRGNLLSRVNFGVDLNHWGYCDGRAWDEQERMREPEPIIGRAGSGGW